MMLINKVMKSGKYDIFISYSRKDIEVVDRFCSILDSVGITYWIDREGIGADSFKSVIVEAIENSTIFVFFSSRNSNQSKWTAKEIGIAVDSDKTIIPLRIDDSPYNSEVRFDLINLNYYDLFNDYQKSLSAVLALIDEKLPHKVDWHNKDCEEKMIQLGLLFPAHRRSVKWNILVLIFVILSGSVLSFVLNRKDSHIEDDTVKAIGIERFDSCRNLLRKSLLIKDNAAIAANIDILLKEVCNRKQNYSDEDKSVVSSFLDSVSGALNGNYDDMIVSGRSRTAQFYMEQSLRIDSLRMLLHD